MSAKSVPPATTAASPGHQTELPQASPSDRLSGLDLTSGTGLLDTTFEGEMKNFGNPSMHLSKEAMDEVMLTGIHGGKRTLSKAATQEHQPTNILISQLFKAIKTNPEAKRLLADALTEDKSYASDIGVLTPATSLSDATRISEGTNNVSANANLCDHPNTKNCSWDCHPRDAPNPCQIPSWQNGNGAPMRFGDEFANETTNSWERQPADESPIGVFRYSLSRFSGCRPVEVMVAGSVYHVHQPVWDRIIAGGGDYSERKVFEDICCANFEAILEFLYTEETKHFTSLAQKDLKELENWVIEHQSWFVLSGIFLARAADVLDMGLLHSVSMIYLSHDIPQFREYFRQFLRQKLQSRLESGLSTSQLVSQVVGHLRCGDRAIEDVAKVLHDLWANAASETSFREQMRPCGCVGDEECSGCIDYEDDYESVGGWENNMPGCPNADWEPSEQKTFEANSNLPLQSQSSDPCAAVATSLGLPPHAFDGLFPGFVDPVRLPTPTFGPTSPNVSFDNWAGPPGVEHDSSEPAVLANTSALAQEVYHWLEEKEETLWTVANGLHCQAEDLVGALGELRDVGLVQVNLDGLGSVRDRTYTKIVPAAPPSLARPCDDVVTENQAWPTRANLDSTSPLARCAYHWLKNQYNAHGCRSELSADQVANNVGFTVAEAQNALEELRNAGVVESYYSQWEGKTLYAAKSLNVGGW